MSLIQVCVLGTVSLALYKAIEWLLRRGIDLNGPDEGNWLTGNILKVFEADTGVDYGLHIADKYGGALRLRVPLADALYVSDPAALQHIIVKDNIFEEIPPQISASNLIFGQGLISTIGEQHLRQRRFLTPVFSLANIQPRLTTLQPIAERLASTLAAKLPPDGSQKEIDMFRLLNRYALDGVCRGILGYPSNSLSEADNDQYVEALRMLGPLIGNFMQQQPLAAIIAQYFSPYSVRKFMNLMTAFWLPTQFMSQMRELRRVLDMIDSGSRKAFAEKKAASDTNDVEDLQATDIVSGMGDMKRSGQAKDIMSIMLKANSASSDTERLTDAELLAQLNVMGFGGLDTTTSALTRCVYLLAQHPSVQVRLRREIRDAMKSLAQEDDKILSAQLPYDVLTKIPFLDCVFKETLRLFPSFPFTTRQTTEATIVPLQFPARSRSGAYTSAVELPKGTITVISIIAANRHREMWGADANEWRPERWVLSPASPSLEEDAASVSRPLAPIPGVKDGVRYPGVYSNMMTFLGGNRSCVGLKFAEMEIKQALASLLLRFHFTLPIEPDVQGHVREIQWKLKAIQIPVVSTPTGDGVTPQMPLSVRIVTEDDFVW